jgi:hypothetical protein
LEDDRSRERFSFTSVVLPSLGEEIPRRRFIGLYSDSVGTVNFRQVQEGCEKQDLKEWNRYPCANVPDSSVASAQGESPFDSLVGAGAHYRKMVSPSIMTVPNSSFRPEDNAPPFKGLASAVYLARKKLVSSQHHVSWACSCSSKRITLSPNPPTRRTSVSVNQREDAHVTDIEQNGPSLKYTSGSAGGDTVNGTMVRAAQCSRPTPVMTGRRLRIAGFTELTCSGCF